MSVNALLSSESEFFEVEDSPYVFIPGIGWFNVWGGDLAPRGTAIPERVSQSGVRISRSEFDRLVAES